MNQRTLGCTSLEVSELCFGTMNFGWRTDESTSFAIMDAYHASGGNFIQALAVSVDPPPCPRSPSSSETVLGAWWRSRDIPRADLVVATRVNVDDRPTANCASPQESIRRFCENSLRRLRTVTSTCWSVNGRGMGQPSESLRRGLDWLVRDGLVRYVAFANLPAWRVVTSLREGFARNHCRIDALQWNYSLLARTRFESEFAGVCHEQRLGFLARSPLGGGSLTRRNSARTGPGRTRHAWLNDRYGSKSDELVTRALCELASDHGCSSAQIALGWVLHHRSVTSAVLGVNSVEHLRDAIKATGLRLAAGELRQLDGASTVQRMVLSARTLGNPSPVFHAGAPCVPDHLQPA